MINLSAYGEGTIYGDVVGKIWDELRKEKAPEMLTCSQCLGKGWYFIERVNMGSSGWNADLGIVRCQCEAGREFDTGTMRERISGALGRIGKPSEFPV
jgi:hypothetical protein